MRPRDGIDDELGRCLREIAEGPLGGPDPPILERRSGMKYVVSWQPQSTESEEVQARSLQVFSKWSPPEGTTFLRFWGELTALVVSPWWRPMIRRCSLRPLLFSARSST
jgi:hypothetical protein